MRRASPFTVLEHTFELLSAEPHPLAVDGRRLGHGLPARQLPVSELRHVLADPTTSPDLQAFIIDDVIDRLQQSPATLVVALGGLLLPAMRRLADQATPCTRSPSAFDVEAELLWRLLLAARRPRHDLRRFALRLFSTRGAESRWQRERSPLGRCGTSPIAAGSWPSGNEIARFDRP